MTSVVHNKYLIWKKLVSNNMSLYALDTQNNNEFFMRNLIFPKMRPSYFENGSYDLIVMIRFNI